MDLKTGKSADKYLFCIFFAFIYLFVTSFSYAVRWSTVGFEILDRPSWSEFMGRRLGLFRLVLEFSHLCSALGLGYFTMRVK